MTQVLVQEIVKYKEKDRSSWTKTAKATVCKLIKAYCVDLEGPKLGCGHSTGYYGFIGDAIAEAVEFCDSKQIRITEWR